LFDLNFLLWFCRKFVEIILLRLVTKFKILPLKKYGILKDKNIFRLFLTLILNDIDVLDISKLINN